MSEVKMVIEGGVFDGLEFTVPEDRNTLEVIHGSTVVEVVVVSREGNVVIAQEA